MTFLSHSLSGQIQRTRLFQTLVRLETDNFAHINQRCGAPQILAKNTVSWFFFISSPFLPESYYTMKLLFDTQRQSGTSKIILPLFGSWSNLFMPLIWHVTRPNWCDNVMKATLSLNLGFSSSWVALMSSVSTLSGEVTGAARKCKLPSQADGRSKVRSSKTEIKAAAPASLSARPNLIKF